MTANEALIRAFSTVSNGERMKAKYAKYLAKVPTNEWVRCKDVDENYHAVAKLMSGLVYAGAAKKRIVDDGIIKFPSEEYRYDDDGNEPPYINAYDEQGNFIDRIRNPKFKGYGRGHYVKVEVEVHAKHTEYKVLPLE